MGRGIKTSAAGLSPSARGSELLEGELVRLVLAQSRLL
jgi:hypothetical protein